MVKKLAFSFLVLFLFFFTLECSFRIFWSLPHRPSQPHIGIQMVPHQTRIWALQPGVMEQFGVKVQVDQNGLRMTEKIDAKRRWLTLGDSSIFGHGLADHDTLHVQLQRAFSQHSQQVEVLCGAVPGYSILQTTRFMDEVGWKQQPDVLLIGNLWSDNNFENFVDHQWLETLDVSASPVYRGLRTSHFWLWLHLYLKPLQFRRSDDPRQKISWIREPYQKGTRRVPLQRYIEALDNLIRQADNRGIGTFILQPANVYRLEQSAPGATWEPYFRAQRQIATHHQIPIIDAASILRAFQVEKKDAFLDEMHPTGKANRWIAESIVLHSLKVGWPTKSLRSKNADPLSISNLTDPWKENAPFSPNQGSQ